MSKDDPLIFSLKKVIASLDPSRGGQQQQVDANIKLEIFNSIQSTMVPPNIALEVGNLKCCLRYIN